MQTDYGVGLKMQGEFLTTDAQVCGHSYLTLRLCVSIF